MNIKQFKPCTLKFQDQITDIDTKKGVVSGYFASFRDPDNPDADGDVFVKGAFKRSIDHQLHKDRIKHLLHHNTKRPIALIKELYEDEKGLYFVSQMSKSTDGKDALIMYEEGIYREHSVGFQTLRDDRKERRNQESKANRIYEVKLFEGSTVTWGADELTPVTGIKSEFEATKALDQIGILLKRGDLSDSLLQALEVKFSTLQNEIKQIKDSQSSTPDAEFFNQILNSLKS